MRSKGRGDSKCLADLGKWEEQVIESAPQCAHVINTVKLGWHQWKLWLCDLHIVWNCWSIIGELRVTFYRAICWVRIQLLDSANGSFLFLCVTIDNGTLNCWLQNLNLLFERVFGTKASGKARLTTILLRDTQQSEGKSCNMGTKNCRQPSQWHKSSIMPIRLKMRITALARS